MDSEVISAETLSDNDIINKVWSEIEEVDKSETDK